jgi:Bacterial regulatory helix-turn-helix protein, lysR family
VRDGQDEYDGSQASPPTEAPPGRAGGVRVMEVDLSRRPRALRRAMWIAAANAVFVTEKAAPDCPGGNPRSADGARPNCDAMGLLEMTRRKNADEYGEPTLMYFRYFLTVYEERSFIKAARRLGMSQPALSTAVMRFEKQLGRKLFIRGDARSRQSIPTEIATAIKAHIESALSAAEAVRRFAAQFAESEALSLEPSAAETGAPPGALRRPHSRQQLASRSPRRGRQSAGAGNQPEER